MSNLATSHPAESLEISPEALELANAYLQNPDIAKVASEFQLTPDVVSNILGRREVKAYIDYVFSNLGFNNRFKMRAAMDAIIAKKFQELDEAGVGSGKDIVEILTLSHKMSVDMENLAIKRIQAEQGGPKNQTNIQINETGGTRYDQLLERLIGSAKC
jgi:hypothetical protein